MAEQKKSIEIECPECKAKFRLWVPSKMFSQWKDGEEIGCVKCRAGIKLERNKGNFRVSTPQPIEEIAEALPIDTVAASEAVGEPILIVDDDALARKMVEDATAKNNFTTLTAKNGTEGLNIIETSQISLVVVDLHLKNPKDPQAVMDGEEFLQRLADLKKDIPAIVTTGRDLIDDIILEPKWYNLNVKAFIQKGSPFWADGLIVKIKEILKKD